MAEFTNILAMDTALGGCTAAVVAGEESCMRSEEMLRGQAEYLVPFAQEAMEGCGVEYGDLDAVLCTVGPGAFTGLRIGMSAAKSFALSLDIPVFGITTTQALALNFSAGENKPCSVILETKRQDFYVQSFDAKGQAVSEVAAVNAEEIQPQSVIIGDGLERFINTSDYDGPSDEAYRLADMAMIAKVMQKGGAEGAILSSDPQPVYLRDADVSQPKKLPRKLGVS